MRQARAASWRGGSLPAIVAICLLAVAARAWFVLQVLGPDRILENDEISYHLLARNLVTDLAYRFPGGLTAFRPPGYPLFVAAWYALCGTQPAVVWLVQALLGAVLAAATYSLSSAALRRSGARLLAALGVACHPVLVYLSGRMLSETLVVTGLTVAVCMMTWRPKGWTWGLALLLGCLVLVRSAVIAFVPFVVAWLFLEFPKQDALRLTATVVAGIGLFVLPWTARNWLRFGQVIPLATEGGVTFWAGSNALAAGGFVEPSPITWREPDPPAGLYGWPGLTERESEQRFYAAAWRWIRANPLQALALLPDKLVRSWSLSYGNEARLTDVPRWVGAGYWLFPLAGLAGLALSAGQWRRLVPLYGLILSATLVTLAFYGSARQAAILIPGACILACLTVERLVGALSAALGRRAAQPN